MSNEKERTGEERGEQMSREKCGEVETGEVKRSRKKKRWLENGKGEIRRGDVR